MATLGPPSSPSPSEIDLIIVECLNDRSDAAMDRAVACGEAALRRAVDLYYGHATWITRPTLTGAGREIGDAWTTLLFRLALAFSAVFLDEIDARRIRLKGRAPISEVVILGYLDDPRAVPLLARCARHRDWIVRYHAVRGLARRDDPDSIRAIDHAAARDCSLLVRMEAVTAIARRDPARARGMYIELLEHPHQTPLIAEQIRQRISRALDNGIQ